MKLDESLFKENYKVGDTIKIINMAGEPQYNGRSGVIDHIDSIGQLHGTWGGLAIVPEEDEIEVIQEVNESVDDRISKRAKERKEKLVNDYKKNIKYAGSESNTVKDWALNKTACYNNCTKDEVQEALKESVLVETTLDDIADSPLVDNDIEIDDDANNTEIHKMLDRALIRNRRKIARNDYKDPINVWIEGAAGAGKTSIVNQWAEANNINLYIIPAATIDELEIGGGVVPETDETGKKHLRKLPLETVINALSRPNSVLFLDELNRATKNVRGTLLKLIGERIIPDGNEPDGFKHLTNMIFTVIATNPPEVGYDVDALDMAEKTRALKVTYIATPKETLNYFIKAFTSDIMAAQNVGDADDINEIEGRLKIVKALLQSNAITFSTPEDISAAQDANEQVLNPRSLKMALDASDGTKSDFLYVLPKAVGPKKYDAIHDALSNYHDVDDKANAVFTDEEKDDFAENQTTSAKVAEILKGYMNSH